MKTSETLKALGQAFKAMVPELDDPVSFLIGMVRQEGQLFRREQLLSNDLVDAAVSAALAEVVVHFEGQSGLPLEAVKETLRKAIRGTLTHEFPHERELTPLETNDENGGVIVKCCVWPHNSSG